MDFRNKTRQKSAKRRSLRKLVSEYFEMIFNAVWIEKTFVYLRYRSYV